MPRHALFLMAAASLVAAPKPAPTDRPPPEPYKPSEGGSLPVGMFKVPDGLEVTLWARSPMLANPTNIDFDAQGRLWVNEGVNYRVYNKGGKRRPEGDRVIVLSDTKGTGVADSVQTFVQDPSWTSPLGIAVIDNVIYVSHAPTIHKFTDVNRDGKFDPSVDRREEFLTGFGGQDHDHSLHALVTGPDGKFYLNAGNCGAVFKDRSGRTFRIASGYVDQRGGAWPFDAKTEAGKPSDDGFVWSSGFSARMNLDGSGAEIIGNGYRNSYEHFPSSFGDLFQGDNDDSSSCRTSFIMERGTAGYTTYSSQGYGSVRRLGQPTPRAHWRQDDPDTMDVGDVYGSGSPTGITVYENGALGDAWIGTLLNCEHSRNTVLSYKLRPEKGSFALSERTRGDFITSNPAREFQGTDFHKIKTDQAPAQHILFRPSDVTVGPDGAVYVADWYDSRVGGHQTLDDTCTGAIYRIAPKGFKSVVPRLDLATPAGAVAALRNPAVHVRHLGFNALKAFGSKALPEALELLRDANPYVAARAVWLLPHLGEEGVARTRERLKDADPVQRQLAFRALRAAGHDPLPIAAALASDADVAVRRDVATSLLGAPADKALPVIVELARRLDVADKNSVAAFGIAARGKEDAVWSAVRKALAAPSAEAWSPQLARIAWILHPAAALADLRARAGSPKLDAAQRSLALETISFIESREAALATIALSAEGSPVKDEAARWALMRMTGSWSEFDVRSELKKAGVYDPAKIVVTPVVVPEPAAAPAYSVKDVLAKQGDASRGAQLVQRCTMCHQVGGNGPGSYAPELKGFVDRQGREAAVRSIVEPSDAIALGYEGVTVRLKKNAGQIDGRLLSGNDPLVIISTGGATQMVPRDRMAGQSRMTRSLMLSADQLGLTAQDVADIVEWMATYR